MAARVEIDYWSVHAFIFSAQSKSEVKTSRKHHSLYNLSFVVSIHSHGLQHTSDGLQPNSTQTILDSPWDWNICQLWGDFKDVLRVNAGKYSPWMVRDLVDPIRLWEEVLCSTDAKRSSDGIMEQFIAT